MEAYVLRAIPMSRWLINAPGSLLTVIGLYIRDTEQSLLTW